MTSLFEPTQMPPFDTDERPGVWVEHDGVWYDAVMWGWSWEPRDRAYYGYVDFYADRRHRLELVHQVRIRRRQDGPGR